MGLYKVEDNEYWASNYRRGEKLNADMVVWARHCHYVEGKSFRWLARALGTSLSTTYKAVVGQTWRLVYPNKYHWKPMRNGRRGCLCGQCRSGIVP